MSDSTEHLSSLMDGELDGQGQRFLIRRLAEDQGMNLAWRRYHLVRACLHQEFSSPNCLVERVAGALSDEQSLAGRPLPAWFRPLAGGAIAASAALFAIIAINSSLLERNQTAPVDAQPGFVAQPTSLDQPFTRQPVPVSFSESAPADRQRINTYILRHNQAAGGSGFVSYLPIVTGSGSERLELEPIAGDATTAAQGESEQGN